MHDLTAAQLLLNRWWFAYDEGHFDAWSDLLTDDVWFTSRTDTGVHPHEAFIASDNRGSAAVLAWQREHRLASPYPLRHNSSNFHVTAERGDDLDFASYLHVTTIAAGAIAPLSTGLADGTLRRVDNGYRLAAVHVVLDFQEGKPLAEYPTPRG